MTEDTVFDAASLTKVLATTPAMMLLIERGKVKLDERVQVYIPEFKGDGKEDITVRQLLTHISGLRPDLSLTPKWSGYDTAIQMACAEKLLSKPGTFFRYSDINFFLLGEVVQRASGRKLEQFVREEIYQPLNMVDTTYHPPEVQRFRIAPTEPGEEGMLRGVVHDPTARRMGGVAGHAGLFTTTADVARYARMLVNGGELDGVRIFKPETVKLMTSVQTPEIIPARRGLGWDIDSGYSRPRGEVFPIGSYGHTGFTGTCLWIDPFSRTFWILLSNRVHPNGKGNILPLQARLGTLAAEAVRDFDFDIVPGALAAHAPTPTNSPASSGHETMDGVAGVLNGIDVLRKKNFAPLKGLRVGLITNPSGQDRQRQPTIDLLKNAPEVQLKVLFSPEHGISGKFDEPVSDSVDKRTGLTVFSLYGERHAPTMEQLTNLDALVFDIQDVGCRFYTFITTLGLSMEAAAKAGLKFFVLDRVNPINGVTVDGPVLTAKSSFVGYHTLPVRYGMTLGELAQMYKAEHKLKLDLTVVPLEGWKRAMWFDQTAQPWSNPSPNMRSLTEAILYPGIGLLERTALSVGRGTDTPFELIGAPYIQDVKLAAELNQLGLAGVRFVPVRFIPASSVFKGESCGGVNIILTDRDHCDVVEVGLAMGRVLHRLYPKQFGIDKMDVLLGHATTIEAIKAGRSPSEMKALWADDLEKFKQRRANYLIY
jgi:uncharacterized protein YbbC (DUF1343 family)/CubicO group peptidase (beta-lactamase class C family)